MKKKPAQRYARIFHSMMDTPAWQSLSCVERALYLELLRRYNGRNNGFIPYSVWEGKKHLHVGQMAIWRAFQGLIERGFIEVMIKGGFSRKRRHATEYRLTEFACDRTNTPATHRYRTWRPGFEPEKAPEIRLKDLEHGTCGNTVRYP
jgi:hypothetical protein